jgi:uncharacterized protein (DUF433 family)
MGAIRAIITSEANVMMGKPGVAGTRVTVESILERLASGESEARLLEAHPRLTPDAIYAAIYARQPPRHPQDSQAAHPWLKAT